MTRMNSGVKGKNLPLLTSAGEIEDNYEYNPQRCKIGLEKDCGESGKQPESLKRIPRGKEKRHVPITPRYNLRSRKNTRRHVMDESEKSASTARQFPTKKIISTEKEPNNVVITGDDNTGGISDRQCPRRKTVNPGKIVNNGAVLGADNTEATPIKETIKVVYCNVNGMAKKSITNIDTILNENKVDIFGVCEHKKRRKHDVPQFGGYNRWASCRNKENGGGTAIWIKKNKFDRTTTIPMPPMKEEWESDQTWVAVKDGPVSMAIGIVYSRPVGKYCEMDEFADKMQALNIRVVELQEKGFKVILMGDFNAKIKKRGDGLLGDDEAGKCLLDMAVLGGLEILNFNPITTGAFTWVPEGKRDNQKKSVLDYILHDRNVEIKSCKIDEARDIKIESDHVPIIWEFYKYNNNDSIDEEPREQWNDFEKVDWNAYNNLVEYKVIKLSMEKEGDEPVLTYDQLHEAIHSAGISIIGKKPVGKPKIKRESAQLIFTRKCLARARKKLTKYMKVPLPYRDQKEIDRIRQQIWLNRQNVRNQEREAETIKTEKFMDSINRECDKNMKNLYTFMNKNKKPIQEKFGLKDPEGNWISNDEDIKRQLRIQWDKIYQSGVWPKAETTNITTGLRVAEENKLRLQEDIDKVEIVMALEQLHAGTSAGTTDIPPELLKHLGNQAVMAIHQWAKQVWLTRDPPVQNDILRTIFLHKKGATDTLDNYRTLTTGCNICKIYNRVLTNRIQYAVEESDILGEIQNGFRVRRRSLDNLLLLETIIRKTKREKTDNFLALLDITKAYDRVDRNILWKVMEIMDFPDILINNLRAAYRNPKSVVHFQNTKSDPLSMELGLKQGCVLSPILFAIYIAELGDRLAKSNLGVRINNKKIPGMFFADDMMLVGSQTDLKALLAIVDEYAQQFKIEFSGKKSSIIPLNGPIREYRKWKLGVMNISESVSEEIFMEEENEGRYLGVTISRKGSIFKPQWELAIQKAWRGAGLVGLLVRRCSNPLTILKPLWQSYILPAVLYGTEMLDFNKDFIEKIDKI
ncbi:MAG: hypothetical protein GY931_10590 [Maribacter sp.]|nr:hypothetical protein [Maribacter sp.]